MLSNRGKISVSMKQNRVLNIDRIIRLGESIDIEINYRVYTNQF